MTNADELTDLLHQWMDAVTIHTMEIRKHFIKSSGLSMPQVSLLMLLFHGGHCGLHEIAERMDFTGPAASQLVDRLVQAGLVERKESAEDRRAREVTLSEKGRTMLDRLGDEHSHLIKNLVRVMTPEERDAALKTVPLLIAAEKRLASSMRTAGRHTQFFPQNND